MVAKRELKRVPNINGFKKINLKIFLKILWIN